MDHLTFPEDIFNLIIDHLVVTIGIYKAVLLRSVNSKSISFACKSRNDGSAWPSWDTPQSNPVTTLESFNSSLLLAICSRQVIDIEHPATPYLCCEMTPPLKGKILLARSRRCSTSEDGFPSVIASVNRALDGLAHVSEERREEQHQMIATAAACQYWRPWLKFKIDVETEAQNLLCGAIILGNLSIINYLLKQRPCALAAVNTESPYFGQPLQLAAAWNHIDVVRYLLARGADPHMYYTGSGESGGSNWMPNMRLVIKHPEWYPCPHGSALRAAILTGQRDIVHLLLEPQYRVSDVKVEYFQAIMAAVQKGDLHLIELLIKITGKRLSDFPGLGQEMLFAAAYHGQLKVVRMLQSIGDSGVDINLIPPTRVVPHEGALSLAAKRGNATAVRFLLDHGAAVNFSLYNQDREDPIHTAAIRGHLEVVEVLLEHGDSPERALRNAADGGQVRLVKWLLDKDPKLVTKTLGDGSEVGKEALHRAIIVKSPEVIRLLVNSGVPLNDGYEDNEMPMAYAKWFSAEWIVDILVGLGAEDRNFDDHWCEDPKEENLGAQMIRGGVRLTQRTWEWASKY